MSLLEIKNLQITFGGLDALSNLDFAIEEGEIVSVIGPNGAGKTTFFNAISGMISPTSGEIIFDGESVLGLDPNQITEMGIARTFQNVRLFPNMTVLENVMVSQHCRTSELVVGALFQTKAFKKEEREIRERAEEILVEFGTLKKEFENFGSSTEDLSKKAEAMLKAVDKHETRERQMNRALKRMEEVGEQDKSNEKSRKD